MFVGLDLWVRSKCCFLVWFYENEMKFSDFLKREEPTKLDECDQCV